MTNYEIQQHIDALYRDLNNVEGMDEETARRVYNVDCKSEIIEVIQDEIDTCKAIMQPDLEDDDMDYDALCEVQGLSRYA
ncbi:MULTISPECIES: hypothetical protein [unclassified Bacteroides]|jgi:hypothetical protein|uniref:hypothetical protein n=1 Tax=unclassified Bacteroides TaxID=2646097 RepID=UPI000E8D0715|nr:MULTISPECIES: hypothetical protein [unclassified Bacteroides]RGN45492.1 hypothetical protein DXB63_12475 [Bacteroides sp. OM05-12]RHR73298.1 hypothetical protein DWW69_14770 [Bacteroides sp. AF16-49]